MTTARGLPGRPPGTARGIGRSLRRYHGDPARQAAMDRLYARFVGPGALVFDIGAHVGDRIASFRRLGARVVALEPQPGAMRALQMIHGRDPDVSLVAAGAGAADGQTRLHLNTCNPTVSTASPSFIAAAQGRAGWRDQVWRGGIDVPVTTLDILIARHGRPDFVKIDVEGWEAEVLAGLTVPLAALSFEWTAIRRDVAVACLERLRALGPYRFRLALGESQIFAGRDWKDADAMSTRLAALPDAANSGDVYACLTPDAATQRIGGEMG